LHLNLFEQPAKQVFLNILLIAQGMFSERFTIFGQIWIQKW